MGSGHDSGQHAEGNQHAIGAQPERTDTKYLWKQRSDSRNGFLSLLHFSVAWKYSQFRFFDVPGNTTESRPEKSRPAWPCGRAFNEPA
jgi:hypothetical protein